MSSLRARLVFGLLALAAIGMLALASVTYAEQRNFLLDRVDQQAQAAIEPVAFVLGRSGQGRLSLGAPGGAPYGQGADPDHDRGRAPKGGPENLPPGTYGVRRDASGRTVGDPQPFGYSRAALPGPRLPAKLQSGRLVTVAATSTDLRYRVYAESLSDGGQVIAAVPLGDVDQTLHRLLLVEALVIGSLLLLLGLAAWWVVRLGLRPLTRMGDDAGLIAAGDLSRRVAPAEPRTEVGRLGLALNAMLARLEDAFAERQASEDRLRSFLADASHELRTPLSSIRGYAELLRMGAAGDEQGRAVALRRIEDEAARMGILVEDLLALARLGEHREPLRELVELPGVVADAVSDARAAAPDRDLAIEDRSRGEDLTVVGDPHALQQVLANLLRNALVHTPAGTPVEVELDRDGADAVVAVRDHGPGLPPGTVPTALFERFWRAEGGRKQGPAGAGLGLAIVAGIVAAHDGRADAADAPGGGARFEVRLPLAGLDAEG